MTIKSLKNRVVGRGGHRGWGPWAGLSEQVSLQRWHLNQELKTKKERAIERFGANASHREMSSGSELSGEGESDMRGTCKLPSIIWRIRPGETQGSRGRLSEWKPREAKLCSKKGRTWNCQNSSRPIILWGEAAGGKKHFYSHHLHHVKAILHLFFFGMALWKAR